ncbi:NAD-binding protein [Bacillus sp. AGMB 02131]|uniref:NAD-binding protein n=1 Tax=Peribacillus faecalis TaxID=2772559 RepID=A0A927CWE0_9BACI|nr:potassium channel family protein [Peribacillus faecalis]MBD3109008.1 NAD-binding protein [Peribacillus faecalis]
MQKLIKLLIRLPRIIKSILIVLLLISFFGLLIAIIEPDTFPSFLIGIWWAIVTTSTVGYGDYVPETIAGKLIGITLILIGAGFVTAYFATLAAEAVRTEEMLLKGLKGVKEENHIIIVGWNEKSRNIISSLHAANERKPIVLIDHTLDKHPDTPLTFHFIKGKAHEDHTLKRANIQAAKKIVITADVNKNEFQADMFSILTLIASKGLNPAINACVEILTETQVINAQRAGADHIIQTNLFAGEKMVTVLLSEP